MCEIQPPIFSLFGVLQVRVRTAAQWSKALQTYLHEEPRFDPRPVLTFGLKRYCHLLMFFLYFQNLTHTSMFASYLAQPGFFPTSSVAIGNQTHVSSVAPL